MSLIQRTLDVVRYCQENGLSPRHLVIYPCSAEMHISIEEFQRLKFPGGVDVHRYEGANGNSNPLYEGYVDQNGLRVVAWNEGTEFDPTKVENEVEF